MATFRPATTSQTSRLPRGGALEFGREPAIRPCRRPQIGAVAVQPASACVCARVVWKKGDRGGASRVPVLVMRKLTRALVAALIVAILVPSAALAVWPVGTRSSYVSQWYSSHHRAIDIAAPYGTRVVPIRSGRTVFAGWRNNCGGYQVWVSHGNGLYSAYYHLRREVSWRGEYVTGGSETIGYVG